MQKKIDEKELIKRLKQNSNDREAIKLLINNYKKKLFLIVNRVLNNYDDTSDVLQEVFIKMWKKISTFKEESEFYTWLYRIAINESINFINKRNRDKTVKILTDLSELGSDTGFDNNNEILQKLYKAIEQLAPVQRFVFNLRYFEELSYKEISKITQKSIGSLKASYHNALKKIEKFLTENKPL